MIISKRIPLHVSVFLNNVQRDYAEGLYSDSSGYHALLVRETRRRYPGLVDGLRDLTRRRARPGAVSLLADADHIVPRSVWPILIPLAWKLPGPPPATPDILSNMFWRTVTCNRGAKTRGENVDAEAIDHIKAEAAAKSVSAQWARNWIEQFLRTKHDEGVNIDHPTDPRRVEALAVGLDLSEVVEFVQRLRASRPGISNAQVADAVENRFPHIRFDLSGSVPQVIIG